MLKNRIDADLKTAMLAGDKFLVTVLRGLKSNILNQEIATGKREEGLSDVEIEQVLAKQAKQRDESAELYVRGGNQPLADKELAEKETIVKYLPQQMGDDELRGLVESVVAEMGDGAQIGQVIGAVKSKAGNSADGGRIASIVRETLG